MLSKMNEYRSALATETSLLDEDGNLATEPKAMQDAILQIFARSVNVDTNDISDQTDSILEVDGQMGISPVGGPPSLYFGTS